MVYRTIQYCVKSQFWLFAFFFLLLVISRWQSITYCSFFLHSWKAIVPGGCAIWVFEAFNVHFLIFFFTNTYKLGNLTNCNQKKQKNKNNY